MHHGIFKAEQAGILSLPVLLPAPAQRHLTRYPIIVAVDGNAGTMPKVVFRLCTRSHLVAPCLASTLELRVCLCWRRQVHLPLVGTLSLKLRPQNRQNDKDHDHHKRSHLLCEDIKGRMTPPSMPQVSVPCRYNARHWRETPWVTGARDSRARARRLPAAGDANETPRYGRKHAATRHPER